MSTINKKNEIKIQSVLNDNNTNVFEVGKLGKTIFAEYEIIKDISLQSEQGELIINKEGIITKREFSYNTYLGCIEFNSSVSSGKINLEVFLDNIGENAIITIYKKAR